MESSTCKSFKQYFQNVKKYIKMGVSLKVAIFLKAPMHMDAREVNISAKKSKKPGGLSRLLWRPLLVGELAFKLSHLDSALYVTADSMFGIALVYIIVHFDLFSHFWPVFYWTTRNMDLLIDWLTQYPAGLKLNDQLNEVLAGFFKYQISLWQVNVKILATIGAPLWKWGKEILFSLALLGASIMLSAFSDFGRIITVHMYCFHIYTLRVTKLSWYAIWALANAFRGKKWNPLRRRIDSVRLDSRELFIATLFFIVLLFLLPTILVYFVVFYCLWFVIDSLLNGLGFCARTIRIMAENGECAFEKDSNQFDARLNDLLASM